MGETHVSLNRPTALYIPRVGFTHPTCSISDDHITPLRSALFMARWVLTEARDRRATC